MATHQSTSVPKDLLNGSGAAAILAAGIGSAVLGLFTLLGDAFPGIGNFFKFYNPTGPLSGVTTSAIVIWLAAWYVLDKMWNAQDVNVSGVGIIAFVLLAIGFALTFPPITDVLRGDDAHGLRRVDTGSPSGRSLDPDRSVMAPVQERSATKEGLNPNAYVFSTNGNRLALYAVPASHLRLHLP